MWESKKARTNKHNRERSKGEKGENKRENESDCTELTG